MKHITTIIFDLDGTLLDTLHDLAAAVNHALASHGLPLRSETEVRSFLGNGIRSLVERAVPDGLTGEQFEQVFETFRTYYMEHCQDRTQPYEGIMPLISYNYAAKNRQRMKETILFSGKLVLSFMVLMTAGYWLVNFPQCGEKEDIHKNLRKKGAVFTEKIGISAKISVENGRPLRRK